MKKICNTFAVLFLILCSASAHADILKMSVKTKDLEAVLPLLAGFLLLFAGLFLFAIFVFHFKSKRISSNLSIVKEA